MIIEEQKNEILSNMDSDATAFTIKASAKAFRTLVSNLYSNKILAVVREVTCNAFDAHVAAGKGDEPVTVHLPSEFEPWFVVKDNGIGLSLEDCTGLFTTMFESTKTSTNEEDGALGLGSKSPLAYTDQFITVSRFNGVRRKFSVFLDETGCPQITMVNETETEEPNGLEIHVPVNVSDIDTFHSMAKRAFFWFETPPKLENARSHDINHDAEYPCFDSLDNSERDKPFIRFNDIDSDSVNFAHNGVYALMGNVAYHLPVNELNTDGIENELGIFKHIKDDAAGIIIPFGRGGFDFAPSREVVSFEPRTEQLFREKITEIASSATREVQDLIDNSKTLEELIDSKVYNKFLFDFMFNKLEFDGKPLSDYSFAAAHDAEYERMLSEHYVETTKEYKEGIEYTKKKFKQDFGVFRLTKNFGNVNPTKKRITDNHIFNTSSKSELRIRLGALGKVKTYETKIYILHGVENYKTHYTSVFYNKYKGFGLGDELWVAQTDVDLKFITEYLDRVGAVYKLVHQNDLPTYQRKSGTSGTWCDYTKTGDSIYQSCNEKMTDGEILSVIESHYNSGHHIILRHSNNVSDGVVSSEHNRSIQNLSDCMKIMLMYVSFGVYKRIKAKLEKRGIPFNQKTDKLPSGLLKYAAMKNKLRRIESALDDFSDYDLIGDLSVYHNPKYRYIRDIIKKYPNESEELTGVRFTDFMYAREMIDLFEVRHRKMCTTFDRISLGKFSSKMLDSARHLDLVEVEQSEVSTFEDDIETVNRWARDHKSQFGSYHGEVIDDIVEKFEEVVPFLMSDPCRYYPNNASVSDDLCLWFKTKYDMMQAQKEEPKSDNVVQIHAA